MKKKIAQVRRKREAFGYPSKWTKRSAEAEDISHSGGTVFFCEEMVMLKPLEEATRHRVLEVMRRVVSSDSCCVLQSEAKVACLPHNFITRFEDALRDTCNSPFIGMVCALNVQIDT